MAHSCRSLSHFCSMKWLEVFLLSLNLQVTPPQFVRFPQQFASTHLYTWVERGTVRVKCLAQGHNTMYLARARTRTAHSGVKHTNHEATLPAASHHIMSTTHIAHVFCCFYFQVVQALAPILILKVKLMEVQMMQYGKNVSGFCKKKIGIKH